MDDKEKAERYDRIITKFHISRKKSCIFGDGERPQACVFYAKSNPTDMCLLFNVFIDAGTTELSTTAKTWPKLISMWPKRCVSCKELFGEEI